MKNKTTSKQLRFDTQEWEGLQQRAEAEKTTASDLVRGAASTLLEPELAEFAQAEGIDTLTALEQLLARGLAYAELEAAYADIEREFEELLESQRAEQADRRKERIIGMHTMHILQELGQCAGLDIDQLWNEAAANVDTTFATVPAEAAGGVQ